VLSWSGPIAVGATATVTYSVTIAKPDDGDKMLDNAVVLPPTENSNCTAGSSDPACATHTSVQSYLVKKTASSAKVKAGDKVGYTITVTNTGQVAFTKADAAVFTDDLSPVLDDAAYNSDAKVAVGTLSYKAPTLTWSGPLPVADTVTITYSVTVHSPDTGDGKLHNVVITPTDPGGLAVGNCSIGSTDPSCVADSTVEAVTIVAPPPTSPLAFTGNDTRLQLIVAALLVACGGLIVLAGVRRRRVRRLK
jgi:uncharacterized repeat protein (TIGR01451 family)